MADNNNYIGTGEPPVIEEPEVPVEKDLQDEHEITATIGGIEEIYDEYTESGESGISDMYHDGAYTGTEDEFEDDMQITAAAIRRHRILRNAYIKLDSLPLSFGIPVYDENMTDDELDKMFRVELSDVVRETNLSVRDIEDNSVDEMQFENRIVYHKLRKFRLTASAFFKFSTAVDGKTVDKSQIPKMLKQILDEYEDEYKKWRLRSTGSLWNRTSSLNMG